jgi:DNA-binding response OmpR family regulator
MQTAPSNTNAPRRQRLLVGERNPALRGMLTSVFAAESYDVVAVATGIDLLDAVSVSLHPEFGSGDFALVIAETSLLQEGELQSFARLADWARLPPVIFITSFGDKAVRTKLELFETVAVLEQPLDVANLRHRVNSFLQPPRREEPSVDLATHS